MLDRVRSKPRRQLSYPLIGYERDSREGGHPFIKPEQPLIWVPACGGRRFGSDFSRFGDFVTLLRGNDSPQSKLE
jgi:hypothetical protein